LFFLLQSSMVAAAVAAAVRSLDTLAPSESLVEVWSPSSSLQGLKDCIIYTLAGENMTTALLEYAWSPVAPGSTNIKYKSSSVVVRIGIRRIRDKDRMSLFYI
jgi:hypothetical protein